MEADEKESRLRGIIMGQESVLVALSGGVDSSVLAKIAVEELGEKAVAATVDSPTTPPGELSRAQEVAAEIGIQHVIVEHSELEDQRFTENPEDRCYYCKSGLAEVLKEKAAELGLNTVLEGTNASELQGHRPGYRAVKEEGLVSPLAEAGYTREEVRALAGRLGLSTAEKPSNACLASRIPHGVEITGERLAWVGEAESILKSLGVSQVRVRYHGELARIEVLPEDFPTILGNRERIVDAFEKVGFRRVALDLAGYRTGSLSPQSASKLS